MKYVPKSLTRAAGTSALKLKAHSPTILVVAGVVGFGATAVMAARATRNLDKVVHEHKVKRYDIVAGEVELAPRERKNQLVKLYGGTTMELARVYGPTIVVGSLSAAAILSGHNILRKRHVATMVAYSGLLEEFKQYRGRVAKTVGAEAEQEIYQGAHAEWVDDDEHPGEKKRVMVYDQSADLYLRPWFDETNFNFSKDPVQNYLFLKGVQQHMNNLLEIRGHVFLNDVFDAIGLPRCREAQVAGWRKNGDGDQYISFGFLESKDPNTVAFCSGHEPRVRLNFNIDGVIWDLI